MTKLLLAGASGHLGQLTLDALLASGKADAADIIAVTRDPAKLADYAARGVSVRVGDFAKPEMLEAAFEGADRIAIISIDSFPRLVLHKAAVEAAKAAGAKHILYTSLPRRPGVPVTFGGDHFETEDMIAATGIDHTFLRNSWYAENLYFALPPVLASGQWFTSAGTGRLAYAPRASYAEALAAAMIAGGSGETVHTLTGTTTYTIDEVAALASRILGKSISVVHVTDEQLAEGLKHAGLPEQAVPTLVSMDANIRNGGLDIVTGDIEKLTGKAPMSLESFIEASKDALLAPAK